LRNQWDCDARQGCCQQVQGHRGSDDRGNAGTLKPGVGIEGAHQCLGQPIEGAARLGRDLYLRAAGSAGGERLRRSAGETMGHRDTDAPWRWRMAGGGHPHRPRLDVVSDSCRPYCHVQADTGGSAGVQSRRKAAGSAVSLPGPGIRKPKLQQER